jgi:hypothetical protein
LIYKDLILVLRFLAQGAVRLSEQRDVSAFGCPKKTPDLPLGRATSASRPVVLENDQAMVMFKNIASWCENGVLEGLRGRCFSTVDKSRQGSHSLTNANVCGMFRRKRCPK